MPDSHSSRFMTLIMIKPTHYDDDGYPITWYRSIIPSNTLASLNGIATDCNRRKVLGDDVELVLEPYDECNRRIQPKKIIESIRARGGKALICLVGVQSNQFPRAVDLAKPFLDAGLPVALGGFHVAGCLSMLDELPPEIGAAMDMGITMFAGEAEEGRLDEVLLDAWNGTLKPLYNHIDDLPALDGQPTPALPAAALAFTHGSRSSFDLGRGCPFQCSFCTIINVQGRKSRFRTPDDLERIVRENAAQGIFDYFVTDDNLARNRHWEAFFDRLIELKKNEGLRISLIIQVDTLCHKIPNFIEKARLAGVRRAFIGLENINPDNLLEAKKRQNKITDYREMLQKWSKHGIYTWAGYITGFPADTKQSILRDIEIIKRELPVDILEIFFLTPLPGSEDHRALARKGQWMDPDLNKYDLHHRVTHHSKMSDTEWEEAYHGAWKSYYSDEHLETIARRHGASKKRHFAKVLQFLTEFRVLYEVEGIHPLEGGIVRLKYRTDRRPDRQMELPVVFHVKLASEVLWKTWNYARYSLRAAWIARKVKSDPKRFDYMDTAITAASENEQDALAMFTETLGGTGAVEKKRAADRRRELFSTSVKKALSADG
ncbi:MAG: radical SAM protein [Anderseniella sp.]